MFIPRTKIGLEQTLSLPAPYYNKDQVTILGVTFDKSLNWEVYTRYVYNKCLSRLFVLRRLKEVLNKNQLKTLYYGFIRSVIEYSNPTFIGMPKKETKKLKAIQRRAHNIICSWKCHCPLFEKLDDRRQKQAINLYLDAYNNKNHILHKLIPNRLQHSGRLDQPYARTERRHRAFIPTVTHIINKNRL